MFIEIGAFEAKSKLSQLLQQVKHGQSYTITVRGRPVADLVPSEYSSDIQLANAMQEAGGIVFAADQV